MGLVNLKVHQDIGTTAGTQIVGHLFMCPSRVNLFLPPILALTLTLCSILMLPCVISRFGSTSPRVANCRQPFGAYEQFELKAFFSFVVSFIQFSLPSSLQLFFLLPFLFWCSSFVFACNLPWSFFEFSWTRFIRKWILFSSSYFICFLYLSVGLSL